MNIWTIRNAGSSYLSLETYFLVADDKDKQNLRGGLK